MNILQFNALVAEQLAGTISAENLALLTAEQAVRDNATTAVQDAPAGTASTTTSVNTNGKQLIKAPARYDLVGQLTDVSDPITRDKAGRKTVFRMISVHDGEKLHVFPMNEKFYQRNLRVMIVDNEVSFTFEQRIEKVTQYLDRETGEVKTHSDTGESVVAISRVSEKMTVKQARELAEKKILGNAHLDAHTTTLLASVFLKNMELVASMATKVQD